jgi:hypothetical protein
LNAEDLLREKNRRFIEDTKQGHGKAKPGRG